jgi:hypothetical protein
VLARGIRARDQQAGLVPVVLWKTWVRLPRELGPSAMDPKSSSGKPAPDLSSVAQLLTRQAGFGAASRNRNPPLPKQPRGRHPTNGNLSSVESKPTPAEADQGSSSDGFEHLSSVQIEASR